MTFLVHTDQEVITRMTVVTAYINAGGRGTRLNGTFTPDPKLGITKSLLQVGSPPITLVEHHVNRLLRAGVATVVVGAGDHHHITPYVAAAYPADTRAHTVNSDATLGNGGDLLIAVRECPELFGEHVVITNVDTLLEVDEQAVVAQHVSTGAVATIVLTRCRGVPNQDAFLVSTSGRVLYSEESIDNPTSLDHALDHSAWRGSSTGMLVMQTRFLHLLTASLSSQPISLYKEIASIPLMADAMAAYDNGDNFFLDVGTDTTWRRITASPEVVQPYLCYGASLNIDQAATAG